MHIQKFFNAFFGMKEFLKVYYTKKPSNVVLESNLSWTHTKEILTVSETE